MSNRPTRSAIVATHVSPTVAAASTSTAFPAACSLKRLHCLQKIMGKASETFKMLVASITDHFELCLTKCRTSSESVHHENSYRDPSAKHCYADEPPGQSRTTKSHVLKE
uniref:SREBP regulating gene protein n=1 Tax=Ixodes ricinus TaxID=34613 RepID=A0A0K8RD95_IXORI